MVKRLFFRRLGKKKKEGIASTPSRGEKGPWRRILTVKTTLGTAKLRATRGAGPEACLTVEGTFSFSGGKRALQGRVLSDGRRTSSSLISHLKEREAISNARGEKREEEGNCQVSEASRGPWSRGGKKKLPAEEESMNDVLEGKNGDSEKPDLLVSAEKAFWMAKRVEKCALNGCSCRKKGRRPVGRRDQQAQPNGLYPRGKMGPSRGAEV